MESPLLHFAEHPLQEFALLFMAIVYTIRVIWIIRKFKTGKERQAPTGRAGTTPAKGVAYSMINIAMPWAMDSTRKHIGFYIQFALFHLGVTMAILLSFIIPYAPGLLDSGMLRFVMHFFIGAAFIVGIMRMVRRISNPWIRNISTPDDYFSLALLTVWFLFAFLSVPNNVADGEWELLTFFFMTAFFLMYVPFSKIGHYLYYPFTRYYLGKTMGYRGIYPLQPSIMPDWMSQQQAKKGAVNEG